MNIEQLFFRGMKRDLGTLLPPPVGWPVLDLGAGHNPCPGAVPLDFPEWDGAHDPIPFGDESVGGVFALHFLEHLTGEQAIRVLREVERVLVPGGVLTVVVPHRACSLAYEDLDHKSFWCEETWRVLFSDKYYAKHRTEPWRLRLIFNMIAGVAERNLCVMSQLVKMA